MIRRSFPRRKELGELNLFVAASLTQHVDLGPETTPSTWSWQSPRCTEVQKIKVADKGHLIWFLISMSHEVADGPSGGMESTFVRDEGRS